MSRIKLDLNDFKHVSSDDKSTKLRHKAGHYLVLAHNALSPDAQKQLGALSKMSSEAQTSSQANEARDQKMAEGGETKVQYPAQADRTTDKPPVNTDPIPANVNTPKSISEALERLKHPMAKGGPVQANPKLQQSHKQPPMPKLADGTKQPLLSQEDYAKKIHGEDSYGGGQKITAPAPDDKSADAEIKDAEAIGEDEASKKPIVDEIKDESDALMAPKPAIPQGAMPAAMQEQPQNEIPSDRLQVQKLYNALVSSNVNDPNGVNTRPWAVFGPNGEPPKSFDANSWAQAEKQMEEQKADAAGASQQKTQQIQADNAVRQRAGLPPIEMPGANQPTPAPDMPPTVPQTDSMAQPAPAKDELGQSMEDSQGMLQEGMTNRLAGINQGAEAVGNLGEKQAAIRNMDEAAKQDAQLLYKKTYDNLEAERQNHMADIKNGYIDPDKYWSNHSKLAAGIGMILAGFNPTNSPNAAINFLKFQMEQNLQAQRENLGAKQNLLSANLRQFGNLRDAMDMTRLMQNDLMQSQLAEAAAKAQSPMAKAAALDAAGKLQMESAPQFQTFAMRRALTGMAGSGGPQSEAAYNHMLQYLRLLNPEQAKEMESHHVPGVGNASITVTPEVRSQLIAKQNLHDRAMDLLQFVNTHTTMNPMSADYKIGQQKALNLQQLWRDGVLSGVYKEGEQPLLDKVVNEKNPAGVLKSINSIPKLKELVQSNAAASNTLRTAYGLPKVQVATQNNQSPQAALNWAKANPQDPRAQQILKRLGQ